MDPKQEPHENVPAFGQMRKAVVTGGAGFIGSHLVEELVRRGVETLVIDNLSSGFWEKIPPAARAQTRLIESDCLDANILDQACDGADCIFHLAAVSSVEASLRDPLANIRSGEMALLGVLESARRCGVANVVYASSAAVYGNPVKLPIAEDHPLQPLSYYGVSKLSGEQYLRAFAQLTGSRVTALRFFNVYGPRQDPANPYSGVISKFIAAAEAGKPVTIFGDGRQTRDFVYVADIANACLAASGRTRGGLYECLNIGTGLATPMNALRSLVMSLASSASGFSHLPTRKGEIQDSVCNPGRARELIGFAAKTKIEDGLVSVVAQYRQ
jgi:UDP-glucose 4-epimerase